ncbi:hypothetical protein B296_00013119 [Ensete ventricosum]|uniref:Dilute domain-containing protein n=1 Tax=Ensete ventricosum TaxID=4639 RepID=A0A427AGA8_ENSVE|nr:hypothetical protein B296_00013119 [Ensete ventricosum]
MVPHLLHPFSPISSLFLLLSSSLWPPLWSIANEVMSCSFLPVLLFSTLVCYSSFQQHKWYPSLSLTSLAFHLRSVIFQKYRISYDEIVNDLCPVLSVQQLYRICMQYWDDKYNTKSVSADVSSRNSFTVLSNMRVLMTEDSNEAESNAFLLDDNSR